MAVMIDLCRINTNSVHGLERSNNAKGDTGEEQYQEVVN